ncbi:adenine-specific DNA-methyltransferase [Chitinophaga sp. W3I9]|uniref:type IIG restriction enzyme/methyltransferase n=1 Tax=Chitinophaga sp. W3I9 TaxID=3373924 RepID=UPI003D190DB5
MELIAQKVKKALNKAYLKEKVSRDNINVLKENLSKLFSSIGRVGDEEHLKSQLTYFLRDTWYRDKYQINPIGKNDLGIHSGKSVQEPLSAIIEVKSITNTVEMLSIDKPNVKALHELILYYFNERLVNRNNILKSLIASNIEEWFLFDANEFDKKIFRNSRIKKLYELKKSDNKDNPFFYGELKNILDDSDIHLECTVLHLRDFKKAALNSNELDDDKLIPLYKVLSPVHLIKEKFANDSNSLDTRFYSELLHIIGLEEIKEGGKKIIKRNGKPDNASLLENTILKLNDRDALHYIKNVSVYGINSEEQSFHIALELCITWINRILFLKLLEAQLFKYHKGDKAYHFLNKRFVGDFDQLNNLFFQILAEKPDNRRVELKEKFKFVPYLNSSLFERTELERQTIDIGSLDNDMLLSFHSATVLMDSDGKKKRVGSLLTLEYLFEFLDAYDFTSEGSEAIQEENKNLINASVLGLIFEKINGYKDGSFFTPGFVTMYMCREVLRRAVVQKFNEVNGWECDGLESLYNKIVDKKEANKIINSITICDPAVGSGHFLVSALNEMISIKSELGILLDKDGRMLRDYDIEVVNDELIVSSDGEVFEYHFNSKESQRVQETIFHEKEIIIENCLFGVDINPNSVKICRLRLWIELLKSAYYKPSDSDQQSQLETLPNIDINIKCGNSLISRFAFDADLQPALRKSKFTIDSYKNAVQSYKHAHSKSEKREMEDLIKNIKNDFRKDIQLRDSKFKTLQKLRGELFQLTQTQDLFGSTQKKTNDWKKKVERLSIEIEELEIEVEEIRNNKIFENAFEWRLEFPEILSVNGDFMGFDVVIGNPPYVQLQKLNDLDKKALEQQKFETYIGKGDLYQLFYEHGINLLRPNGLLCYITSNKWMRTDYGKVTRAYFSRKCNVRFVVDFGMAQMFDSATTYTNILLLNKEVPETSILMCRIGNDYDVAQSLDIYVPQNLVSIDYPVEGGSWIAYDEQEYELIKRIEAVGKPLKDWDIQINRGILTGYNEAFIISTETRNELIAADARSAEIIHPILRGEDIQAYSVNWPGKWIIGTFPALNIRISDYPAIEKHLLKYKKRLEPKPKKYMGKWEGRKSGSYEWFETQDSISYYRDFLKPKIIYPNMTKYLPFVYDKHQFFTNDKSFILTGSSLKYLIAFFNSKIFRFAFKEYFPELLGESRELRKVFFETIPVLPAQDEDWFEEKINLLLEIKALNQSSKEIENIIDEKFFDLYNLTDRDRLLLLSRIDFPEFSRKSINALSVSESE